jgi:hypothetical protein
MIFYKFHKLTLSLSFFFLKKKIELVNNPQFLKEILEEQEQLYKSNEKSYYSTEQIARMEKLDSFIKETLRVNVNNGKRYVRYISLYLKSY